MARLILTSTRTYHARSADHLALLVELVSKRGPGETAELSRRLGWDRSRLEGACRDAAGEVRKCPYGWELTPAGRIAMELGS